LIAIVQMMMLLLLFLLLLLLSFGTAAAAASESRQDFFVLAKKRFCMWCQHIFIFLSKGKKQDSYYNFVTCGTFPCHITYHDDAKLEMSNHT